MSAVLQECPTIPGLLCDEPQQTGQQAVIDNLRVINAEQRVQLGIEQDEASRLRALLHESQRLNGALQARGDRLQQQVYRLKGETYDTTPGMLYAYLPIQDGLELVIEAEHMDAIPATRDDPGEDAQSICDTVLIQGQWVCISDLISALRDRRTITRLIEKAADNERMRSEEP